MFKAPYKIYQYIRQEMGYLSMDFDEQEKIMCDSLKLAEKYMCELKGLKWYNIFREIRLTRLYEQEMFRYDEAKRNWFTLLNCHPCLEYE